MHILSNNLHEAGVKVQCAARGAGHHFSGCTQFLSRLSLQPATRPDYRETDLSMYDRLIDS
jgi:hypothetical protein